MKMIEFHLVDESRSSNLKVLIKNCLNRMSMLLPTKFNKIKEMFAYIEVAGIR